LEYASSNQGVGGSNPSGRTKKHVSRQGRNIANKGYLVGAYELKAFGWDQWVVGDPRTWGVSVQYRIR